MDRSGVRKVPEGSGEQRKMEQTGCKIICGAPTTPSGKKVKVKVVKMKKKEEEEEDACQYAGETSELCDCLEYRLLWSGKGSDLLSHLPRPPSAARCVTKGPVTSIRRTVKQSRVQDILHRCCRRPSHCAAAR